MPATPGTFELLIPASPSNPPAAPGDAELAGDEGGVQPALLKVVADADGGRQQLAVAFVGGDDGGLMARTPPLPPWRRDRPLRCPARPSSGSPLFEGGPQRRHLGHQRLRHRRAAGFVLRQALVAPAVGAILIIEHRHRVGGLTVDDQLLRGMQAGIDAG